MQLETWEINLIEQDWERSQKRIPDFELIQIFPEAREFLRDLANRKLARFEYLRNLITESLRKIKESKQEKFEKWFKTKIIRVWFGQEYNKLSKEIKKLIFLLKEKKEIKNDQISDYDIVRARQHSIEEFVPLVRGDFALCPLTKERHPSFHVFGENKEKFCCFSCGEKGDVLDLVQRLKGFNFPEAVKFLNH